MRHRFLSLAALPFVVALPFVAARARAADPPPAPSPDAARDHLERLPTHVSPDGRAVAVCADGRCDVWDVATGRRSRARDASTVRGWREPGGAMASDDGLVVGRVEDGVGVVARAGAPAVHLASTGRGAACDLRNVAIDATGARAAGACASGALAIWDTRTGRIVASAASRIPLGDGLVDVAIGERGVVVMQIFPDAYAPRLGAVLHWPAPDALVQPRQLVGDAVWWCVLEPRGRWLVCRGGSTGCSVAREFAATVIGDTKLDWYDESGGSD